MNDWHNDPWYKRCRMNARRQQALETHVETNQEILRDWQENEMKKPKEPEWPRLDKTE